MPRPSPDGHCPDCPTDYRPILRALLLALDRWIQDDTPPPASRYPKISDGTLTDWREQPSGWNALPGVRYPEAIQQPSFLYFGPHFASGLITVHPPRKAGDYRVLAPAYQPDNNEKGMILLPSISVPVATFTGWNLRHRKIGSENTLLNLKGSYIPLPRTSAEREATGDPRQSLAERYGNFETYLTQYRAAAEKLVSEGYLLADDIPLLMDRANARREVFSKP